MVYIKKSFKKLSGYIYKHGLKHMTQLSAVNKNFA